MKYISYYYKIFFFDIMKCNNCGFENKNTAKFCSRCGASLENVNPPKEVSEKKTNNNSMIIIAVLVAVIVILAVCIGFFVLNANNNSNAQSGSSQASSQSNAQPNQQSSSSSSSEQPQQTTSAATPAKDWKLIGSYSGSGSGAQSINVPSGQIMIKISAYPIKNYATNYLRVSGPSGESVGVDWGPNSAVETRSNSMTFTSSSSKVFTIKYYETVSWKVEFYRYE